MAVHDRPAAFEGSEGRSYSVDIATDDTGDPARPFGAYLLFIQWSIGDPVPSGHLETGFLAYGETEESARGAVAALSLQEVRSRLDACIRERDAGPARRPWWEAMRDEGETGA